MCKLLQILAFGFLAVLYHPVVSKEHFPIPRSPVGLESWATFEVGLFDVLTKPRDAETLKKFTFPIRRYVQDFQRSVQDLKAYDGPITARVRAIITNPIPVLRMVRRLAFELPDLRAALSEFPELGINFAPNSLTYKDVQDAMVGILRISNIYDLPAAAVANGILAGVHTGAKLDAIHCYEIGLHAIPNVFYDQAIDWLELALAKTAEGDGTVPRSLVKAALEEAIDQHDATLENPPPVKFPGTFDRKLAPLKHFPALMSLRRRRRNVYVEQFAGNRDTRYNDVNFWALCSSGSYQTPKEISTLFCWYESSSHPYWKIGPLKLEMLARSPDVLQFYDLIGDERIALIKDLAKKNLVPSEVVKRDNSSESKLTPKARTSVHHFVNENPHPTLRSLLSVVEKVTGLHAVGPESGDMMQVASYTFSGHFDIHIDTVMSDEQIRGHRMATLMFYLEEPELGGYTAFPQAGTRAMPIKGSAVLWFTLHSDETPDYSSSHGGCPVILGHKWVANKWMRYNSQFLVRKCGMKPQEQLHFVANNTVSSTL